MAIESLQSYIEANCPTACVPVDLLKIARSMAFSNQGPRADFGYGYEYPEFYYPTPFCLVIDAECCIHRMYGGFFGDWVCGGQWNRMVDYLTTFFHVLVNNNIEVAVFLNGAGEPHRLQRWIEKQRSDKEKITQVLKHLSVKGTPPPKVWWVAPNCLRSCLRMALRHLNVNVVMTSVDHHQEVMNFVKQNQYHGLIAEDSEYFAFDPPRYFSAELLKLTFKGFVETKEYIMDEVTRCLNLHPSRLGIVAALLGNHILSDIDLAIFHHSLCPDVKGRIPPSNLIKAVVDFVRNLASVDDLDNVAKLVFGASCLEKCQRFKQCIAYYAKGSKNPNRFPTILQGAHVAVNDHASHGNVTPLNSKPHRVPLLPTPDAMNETSVGQNIEDPAPKGLSSSSVGAVSNQEIDGTKNISKFASESDENELSSLEVYRQVIGSSKHGSSSLYQILSHHDDRNCDIVNNFGKNSGGGDGLISNHKEFNTEHSISNSGDTSMLETSVAAMNINTKTKRSNKSLPKAQPEVPLLPKVSAEVMRVARERHERGLMEPAVFEVLSQGELKLHTTFEDDLARDLPSPVLFFRPIRQMVYAILFNHHHLHYLAEQNKEKDGIEEKLPEIVIKEWLWTKGNKYNRPDLVPSVPLGWAVPTVTRLWLGTGVESNKRRLQAFFTCMRSTNPLMRNTNYVPQHCMILCCVLRFIVCFTECPILRKQELDSFLVQAVDPHLTDVQETQKLELPLVSARGVQLAALFMQGVENALLANDACGAPIPWLMCCPWLFFDGKIFHRMLLKANNAKNLIDLCDNRIEEVAKVERMKTAILEGLQVHYAHSPVASVGQRTSPFPNFAVPLPGMPGRGRGHQRVVPRGGQLEVAGVVVGSWGPNFGQGPRSPTRSIPPQVVSVGGAGGTRGRIATLSAGRSLYTPQTNKSNVMKLQPENELVKSGNDIQENISIFRSLGRGLVLNRDKIEFNMNQHVTSNDSTNCWEGSFSSNEKD